MAKNLLIFYSNEKQIFQLVKNGMNVSRQYIFCPVVPALFKTFFFFEIANTLSYNWENHFILFFCILFYCYIIIVLCVEQAYFRTIWEL